jgi:hypothetical protein
MSSDDTAPDPHRVLKLAKQTLSSAERRKKYNRISYMGPEFWYPSQMGFLSRTQGDQHQRILTGGNQSGKTRPPAALSLLGTSPGATRRSGMGCDSMARLLQCALAKAQRWSGKSSKAFFAVLLGLKRSLGQV